MENGVVRKRQIECSFRLTKGKFWDDLRMLEKDSSARLTIQFQNIETTARDLGFLGRGVRRRNSPQNPAHLDEALAGVKAAGSMRRGHSATCELLPHGEFTLRDREILSQSFFLAT